MVGERHPSNPFMTVQLYICELVIDEVEYSFTIPAKSFEHAEELIDSVPNAQVLGGDVTEVTAIPVPQLIDFLDTLTGYSIKWPGNANEALEAFLSCGWDKQPNQT